MLRLSTGIHLEPNSAVLESLVAHLIMRMLQITVAGIGCLLPLGGCSSTQETFAPDGSKAMVISCTPAWTGGLVGAIANASTNWGTCMKEAGDRCGTRGYRVLTRSDEPGFQAAASQYGGFANSTNNRMMVVECGQGAPALAGGVPQSPPLTTG